MILPLSAFPALDASLNAASAALLTAGYVCIRNKRILAHKICMLSALGTSSIFLACYLWYHAHHGVTHFTGEGAIRTVYFGLLGTHTVLAGIIVPMVLATLYRAWKKRFDQHKRLARWTLPLWLYVSMTGVVVYWMLYHLYR